MEFLKALDKLHLRTQYAKIILLSFDNEQPICEIQGKITAGSLTVNGSSAIRRTISLTMQASVDNSNIQSIDNEISINKKVKVLVGYKNPLIAYSHYGDIVWFPCGLFVLSSASIARSTSNWNISISGKDKMCLLDGTAGGTLPASTTFHESLIQLNNGDYEIQYPTIFQIIFEAVNHWGGELAENIVITDIDDTVKMLVRYMGDNPIYFDSEYSNFQSTPDDDHLVMISYGQDAGYQETEFTYPDDLILNAGDTVATLLDKVAKTLGNYEYFYDLDGRFIFQEIKNYVNTSSPIYDLSEEDYVRSYDNAKFLYSLTDLDTTTAITISPKYDNVKNDFYVWGERTTDSGVKVDIRYHLAIDEKPDINLAGQYMWEIRDAGTGLIVRYDWTTVPNAPAANATLIGVPCDEWREELYRLALDAQVTNSVYNNYYDNELIAEWRNLYNPMKDEWDGYNHWNPDVFNNPSKINYWLDFIDTGSALGKYSVNQIGRRTKVVNSSEIKSVYNSEVPDVIFMNGFDRDKIADYVFYGQRYCVLNSTNWDKFSVSSTGSSCFDKIREMLYQNLSYNTTISIICLPKYYMEPNNIIYIEDKASGISGNYQVTQFTLPLAYNGTMSITATEVLTRV